MKVKSLIGQMVETEVNYVLQDLKAISSINSSKLCKFHFLRGFQTCNLKYSMLSLKAHHFFILSLSFPIITIASGQDTFCVQLACCIH